MLRIALGHPCYEAIQAYFEEFIDEECCLDQLSEEDWNLLQDIHKFLAIIADTTVMLESNSATLDRVLPAMDWILKEFEERRAQYKDNEILKTMFQSGWEKLTKYYKKTDETPVYVAGLVLNPSFKWEYILKNWNKDWHEGAKKQMEQLWAMYKPSSTVLTPLQEAPAPPKSGFLQYLNQQMAPEAVVLGDEYKSYCAQPCINVRDARKWWLEDTQQKLYPNLSKLALDILSIPAMSAEVERLFSATKLTITDLRTKLGLNVVEALLCLKSWYKLKSMRFIIEDILIGPAPNEEI
jgi:hypothetical protein